jgi:hypothetical protein
MIIELYTKTNALTRTIEVSDGAVPRVGETIALGQDVDNVQGLTELLVFDVTHVLKNGALTPVVRCQYSVNAENRLDILNQHGWLNPAD